MNICSVFLRAERLNDQNESHVWLVAQKIKEGIQRNSSLVFAFESRQIYFFQRYVLRLAYQVDKTQCELKVK